MSNKKEFEWDLNPLLKRADDTEINSKRKIIEEKHKEFSLKWKNNKAYLTDAKKLKQALDDYEDLLKNHASGGNEYYYFILKYYVNQSDNDVKSKLTKAEDFVNKLKNEIRFFALSIAKNIPENKQKEFLNNFLLKDYKHYLENSFKSGKHLLTENEEKIMTLKSKVAYDNWEKLTQEFLNKSESEVIDLNGKKKLMNFNEISGLIVTQDNELRKNLSDAFDSIVSKYQDVAEAELNSLLENKKIDDGLRNFSRADSSRHLDDDIDSEIVDALIKTVSSNFNLAHRFHKLKAKLVGLKKLQYNDRKIELKHLDKEYNYEESLKLVREVFSSVDKEFLEVFNGFVKNNQLDVFPRKGKRGGAFCIHLLKTQPTYIMLNHTNKLNDVLTIAHEVGHGINNELIKKKQNSLNFETPKATAEVASTFMEDFVLEELLKEANEEQKLALMLTKLQGDIQNIFRQVACYMFELKLHQEYRKKGYLSKEDIGKLFEDTMMLYLGETFERSDSMKIGWIYWSHIRDHFYVYSYASGLLISKYLQAQVKKDKKFISKVKEFLSAGTSKSPKEIFMSLGIDITKESFWISGLKEIEAHLIEAEKLAKKLKKV